MSQNSYGPFAAGSSSAAPLQSSYGQFEALRSSRATSQISYSPYEANPSWVPTSQASYGPNEAVHSALHPSTVTRGDIGRPAHSRTQRIRRARPATIVTRQWYCCQDNSGPYDSSLYTSCALVCGHIRCEWCWSEVIQVQDYEAPRTYSPTRL